MHQNNQNQQYQSMEPTKPDNDRNRIAIIIAVVLLLAGLAAFVVYYLIQKEKISTDEIKESTSSFFPLIPIWIAIFIPTFIKKKNQGQLQDAKQKRIKIVILAITLALLIAGLAAWFFYANQ